MQAACDGRTTSLLLQTGMHGGSSGRHDPPRCMCCVRGRCQTRWAGPAHTRRCAPPRCAPAACWSWTSAAGGQCAHTMACSVTESVRVRGCFDACELNHFCSSRSVVVLCVRHMGRPWKEAERRTAAALPSGYILIVHAADANRRLVQAHAVITWTVSAIAVWRAPPKT